MSLVDVDGLLLGGGAFYRESDEDGVYFPRLDESLVDLTILLRGLESSLLHLSLQWLLGVEDKLLEIPSGLVY